MRRLRAAVYADIFTAAVIVSVAVALGGLTWRLIAGASRATPPRMIATVPRADLDIAPILTSAPFGNGGSGPPIPTTLPLELRGVMMSLPASASSALIAPTGGSAMPYAVGQPVPGGATIEAIGIDSVTLAIGGHREVLTFPKRPVVPGAGVTAMSSASAVATPSVPPATNALAASPQSLMDGLAATPTTGGYRVGEGMLPIYRQTGVQPGDIIEQVNGTRLGNPAIDQQALAAAARSGAVQIDIRRGDRRVTLSFPVR